MGGKAERFEELIAEIFDEDLQTSDTATSSTSQAAMATALNMANTVTHNINTRSKRKNICRLAGYAWKEN